MKTSRVCFPKTATVLTLWLVLAGVTVRPAQTQTFTTLYNFTGGSDGGVPTAGVDQDPTGHLYGTAYTGGDLNCWSGNGCGVVYKLNTAGRETVLHSFSGNPDGWWPFTPVVRDKAGSIYGTTAYGGSGNCQTNPPGCGVVFKIDSRGNETVLYSFTGGLDGCYPLQGLVRDNAGSLYGTTQQCGTHNDGTIFKVDSAGKFALLHSFAGGSSDGAGPADGHLTMDKSGNLYGVTAGGGSGCAIYGCGVLYKLSKSGKPTLLYKFKGESDGCYPYGSVLLDEAGNLYGTASAYGCGSKLWGTIWRVSKKGKETTLHNFAGYPSDGCNPSDGVTRDSKGNLYGVTSYCGANDDGALYELSAKGKLTLVHSFAGADGKYPEGEALWTNKGTLLGTASNGGAYGYGTVWKYVP